MQDISSVYAIPAGAHSDAQKARDAIKVRKADYVATFVKKPNWFKRMLLAVARIFTRQRPSSAIAVMPVPVVLAHQAPLAFKAGSSVTLISPIGAYAGKSSTDTLRKMAEQQFHRMEVSYETAIN